MRKTIGSTKLALAVGVLAALVFSGTAGVVVSADPAPPIPMPTIPSELPQPEADGIVYLPGPGGEKRATTINSALQTHLSNFITENNAPISAIVVMDAKTGGILAMAQGQKSEGWGGKSHTALHAGFPAASLFKTIVTTAAFEVADVDAEEGIGLLGGCAHVRESGDWLGETARNSRSSMSLRRAFGASCNGFFAKLAVNNLGIGIITQFAKRFGWEAGVPADFQLDRSPFFPPSPQNSSTHTVGRFAAGFGPVGMSAVHAAYMMSTIANQGLTLPVRLFRDSPVPDKTALTRIFSEQTSSRLKQVMDATTHGGTATFAFGRGKYKKLRDLVGGKTGTLTGNAPKGLTTWFAGMAPLGNPEVVVAAVVVLEDRWRIKGPTLAAEGFWAYFDEKTNQKAMTTTETMAPVAKDLPATAPAALR